MPKPSRCLSLTLFFSVFLLAGCGDEESAKSQSPRLVLAMQVGDASALADRWVPGRARATRELDLSFRVGGRMIARPVVVGDVLAAGELVAKLDPSDYEVELQNAEGNLGEANAALGNARTELQRMLNIQKTDPGAISKVAVDRARGARDAAQAGVKALEAAVADARNRLERTTLRAPFDATVVARYAEAFEDVRPNQPIVRLVDTSRIEFLAHLPESEISTISEVTNLRVQFDAFPGLEVPAELKEVGTEASLTTRTFPVTLIMDQPEGYQILPGMAGRANGDAAGQTRDGHVIPLSAVFTEEGGSEAARRGDPGAAVPPADRPTFVWVVKEPEMTVSRRPVTPGAMTARGLRITEGIEAGEWLVTAGVYSVLEGQQVRISQQRPE